MYIMSPGGKTGISRESNYLAPMIPGTRMEPRKENWQERGCIGVGEG